MAELKKQPLPKKAVKLSGKWNPSDDKSKIGENFTTLKNMCYTDFGIRSIAGMTKVHSNPINGTYYRPRSAFQYIKTQPAESHILVQTLNTGLNASAVFRNQAVVPGLAEWGVTALNTDAVGAGTGRFSLAPNESLAYCNGKENLIWSGDETAVDGFIVFDPNDINLKYDYSDVVRNTLTNQLATMRTVGGGNDGYCRTLLHMDGNNNDSSPSAMSWVSSGVTWGNTNFKKLGSDSGYFNGSAYVYHLPDSRLNFSGGLWSIDGWYYATSLGANRGLFGQFSDANNYMWCWVDINGSIWFQIVTGGVTRVTMYSVADTFKVGQFNHVEVTENGDDYAIYCNGKYVAQVTTTYRPIYYTSNFYFGLIYHTSYSAYFIGYLDELRISIGIARHLVSFSPMTSPYSASATCNLYILSTVPLKGIKPYIYTANASTASVTGTVWTGSWDDLVITSDNTAVGGRTLAQTGWILFDDTKDTAKVKMISNNMAYAYHFVFTGIDATTKIYYCTRSASMQPIRDIWDGVDRMVLAFYKHSGTPASYADYTLNVAENMFDPNDAATYIDISNLATTEFLIGGWNEKISAITFGVMPGYGNVTANTVAAVYYTEDGGVTWISVGPIDDGTIANNISMAQSGTISWNMPDAAEDNVSAISRSVPLYHYKVVFDKAISASVRIYYVSGIPQQTELGTYKFPLMANDMLLLCCNESGKKNSFIYSAIETNCFFNGDESGEIEIGEGGELTGGAFLYAQYNSNLYNLTILFKKTEMWKMSGTFPDWIKHCISTSIGLAAPLTLQAINLPGDLPQGLNRNVIVWQGNEGIYISDGRTPIPIHNDIKNYFDKNKPECINAALVENSIAWIDPTTRRYHIKIASGADATGLNTELAFDYYRWRWFLVDRGSNKDIVCALSVNDIRGNSYPYGFIDTGYMLRMEYGETFDGELIENEFEIGDIILSGEPVVASIINRVHLTVVSGATNVDSINYKHYVDTELEECLERDIPMVECGRRLLHTITPLTGTDRVGLYHSGNFKTVNSIHTPGATFIPFEATELLYVYQPAWELEKDGLVEASAR